MNVPAMFICANGVYYKTTERDLICAPMNANITEDAITTQTLTDLNQGVVDLYAYHTDLTAMDNDTRVSNMKTMIIDEKIKQIEKLNHDYVISVVYELFNNENRLIKTGESAIAASYKTILIPENVKEDNKLTYRK